MNLDAAKRGWNRLDDVADARLSEALDRALADADKLGWGLFRRDLLETGAAVFVIACFLPAVWSMPGVVARVGAAIVIGSAAIIPLVLHVTRRIGARSPADLPVNEHLATEIRAVDRQIALLRNVAWWYAAPCLIGASLFVLGLSNFEPIAWAMCALFAVFGYLIHWLNQGAVRRTLMPMRESLSSLRDDLASDAKSAD